MFHQTPKDTMPGVSLAIDLHGLSVKQSKEKIAATFKQAQEKKASDLTIVTGIGNHINKNGSRGVLFKALPQWLKNPAWSGVIKEVKQDMGAYEIQFNFEDSYASYIEELSQTIQSSLEKTEKEPWLAELEQKAQEGHTESQGLLGSLYVNGIVVTQDVDKGLPLLIEAAKENTDVQVQLGTLFSSNHCSIKDYKQAIHWFLLAAKENHPHALFSLGKMYWLGRGVIKQDKKAISYLTHAAELDHPDAAHSLADIYFAGVDSIKQDLKLAVKFYTIAAKAGRVDSELALAKHYFFAWGVDQDDKEAFVLFNKAALKEDAVALYYVGYCYETGRGVEKDFIKAAVWYKKSAKKGDLDAQFNVAYGHLTGVVYKKDIEAGLALLSPLAEKNHVNSLYVLGSTLLEKGLYQNIPRAKTYIHKAAELGQLDAQKLLVQLYLEDQYGAVDEAQALYWLRQAANQNDAEAWYLLGTVDVDCLIKAADLGHVEAQRDLAIAYSRGNDSVPIDLAKAFYYFQKAALQGDVDAITGLGYCYLEGFGVKANHRAAKEHFAIAARKGDKIARENLIFLLLPKNDGEVFSEEAIDWLELAAQEGEEEHQRSLGYAYDQLGGVHDGLGDYRKAADYYEKSLAILLRIYGNVPHPDVATTYTHLALIRESLEESQKALGYHKHALTVLLQVYGDSHLAVATSYENIGIVYHYKLHEPEAARESLLKALAIYKKFNRQQDMADVKKKLAELPSVPFDARSVAALRSSPAALFNRDSHPGEALPVPQVQQAEETTCVIA